MAFTPQGIWSTIGRARLIRVLAVYLGVSFAALEAISIVTDQVGLPDWVVPFAFVLLLIGLPIIVATALAQSASAPAPMVEAVSVESPVPESDTAPTPGTLESAKHWLTWRRAILGGVIAFALLGVAVTGYMTMRVLGIGPVGSLVAAGTLDPGERIILADFQSETGDTLLAAAATEAFRIDFAQSPLVNIAEPEYVRRVLERMGREAGSDLDPATAREAAIREGLKAVVEGEINSAGTAFVVSAALVAADGSATLAAYRETAADSSQVISAIDRVSKKLRAKIGESLRTIRANEPLDSVTTSSLEALRKYSQGIRALDVYDRERGVALLREAVALDTTFAMAYRKLGLVELNWSDRVEALTNAYEHRDRLTERERYLTIGTYHAIVTEDRQQAITAYRSLLDIYPDHTIGINNLAVMYGRMRDFAAAEELYLRAIELDPSVATYYANATNTQVQQGKFEVADSTLTRFREALPDHLTVWSLTFHLAIARGDYEAAGTQLSELGEVQGGSMIRRADISNLRSTLAELHGRLVESERHSREASSLWEQAGFSGQRLDKAVEESYVDITFRADTVRAIGRVDRALEESPLDSMETLDRPYLALASFYAFAGQPEEGRRYIAEWEAAVDPVMRKGGEPRLHSTLARIARAEGRYEEAIAEWRLWAGSGDCTICGLWNIAEAFERAGQADSAIAYYELSFETPSLYRLWQDSWQRASAYERLGELYEARGDTEKALLYYGRFADLWQDADPELQPRVEAARRAITSLSSDR